MLDDLRPGRTPARTGPFPGRFADSASDPGDELRVIVPAFNRQIAFGPAPWAPRVDASGDPVYPTRGDRCLVAIDSAGDPWVLMWEQA